MMEWLTVISILLIGIGLIFVELIFVPGTTIVGLLGLGFAVTGVFLSFGYFGQEIGWIILIVTSVFSIGSLIYALRSGAWHRFSNKSAIKGKVNEGIQDDLKEGDIGTSTSALRPIGKAEFSNNLFEVRTNGNYLEAGNSVKIIRIDRNKIIVELNN